MGPVQSDERRGKRFLAGEHGVMISDLFCRTIDKIHETFVISRRLGDTPRILIIAKSIVLLCLVVNIGCAIRSDWSNPGTISRQQIRAMSHDPYTDNDIGPDVIGGRPRDYQKQIPEAVRNQSYPLNLAPPLPARLY